VHQSPGPVTWPQPFSQTEDPVQKDANKKLHIFAIFTLLQPS